MPELPTGPVTFLLTDIEGSTRLWEEHPEAMRESVARHDALGEEVVRRHGGALLKSRGEGDSLFAVFTSATEAVAAACVLQLGLKAEAGSPAGIPFRVRMALHTGEADLREGDYYGQAVNRCARIRAAAHGGQVLLSRATADEVRDSLPVGLDLKALGSHRLKDLRQPEQLCQLLHPDLVAAFPPLRSLQAVVHNLPIQLTTFIGRERELREVRALLAGESTRPLRAGPSDESRESVVQVRRSNPRRLLTLTGAGGSGKSRMAVQLAAELVEEYRDGVWLVELAAVTEPYLVPQAVAAALGAREEPGRALGETLMDYLRPRELILVLDNCEHLLPACAELVVTLLRGCRELTVVTTSREALKVPGETTYRVPSMQLPPRPGRRSRSASEPAAMACEAVQLFVDRATAALPSFEPTSGGALVAAEVCRRLDGLPLAIELAAARVTALPVEQILARLDDRFRLLTTGSRTALPRHQTLRALIDWNYDLLDDRERVLLRRLSVFAGGWTLEAAEAVCGSGADGVLEYGSGGEVGTPDFRDSNTPTLHHSTPPLLHHSSTPALQSDDVLDLLAGLVSKSLVIYETGAGEGRYRLLETVRQYSRERLIQAGEEHEALGAHLGYFVALAEQADSMLRGPQQAVWLARLDAEHDNLRAALKWSLDRAEVEAGLRLAPALAEYWQIRGHVAEGTSWLESMLIHEGAASHLRARVFSGAGTMAWLRGDSDQAIRFHQVSLGLSKEAGEPHGVALALLNLGAIHAFQLDDSERGLGLFAESLRRYQELQDDWGIARVLNNLAVLSQYRGDFERAGTLYEEAAARFERCGDMRLVAWLLGNLAGVRRNQGDYHRAVALVQESLRRGRDVSDRESVIMDLEELAYSLVELGRPQVGVRLLGAADATREADGYALRTAERPDRDESIARMRDALGPERFACGWAEGQAMALDDAVGEALRIGD